MARLSIPPGASSFRGLIAEGWESTPSEFQISPRKRRLRQDAFWNDAKSPSHERSRPFSLRKSRSSLALHEVMQITLKHDPNIWKSQQTVLAS